MSESIKIKEGGVDRFQNQINKIKTNMQGGGVCLWVPETELQTDDKRITQNGTYTAEDEGFYGYDEIDVNIPGTGNMSGKGEDGNDYSITVDDNGYIVETKIPSAIQITTPPAKTTYSDGETIDYSGMVVKLYDANGNLFTDENYPTGVIPPGELMLPDQIAHYDGSGGGDHPDTGGASFEKGSGIPYVYYTDTDGNEKRDSPYIYGYPEGNYFTLGAKEYASGYYYEIIVASETKSNWTPNEYSYGGKVVCYSVQSNAVRVPKMGEVTGTNAPLSPWNAEKGKEIAWTMIYGNTGTSTQSLRIQWISPYNSKTLETSQDITVAS